MYYYDVSRFVQVRSMTFAQQRNRLTTHFSETIPVVKRRIYVVTADMTHTMVSNGKDSTVLYLVASGGVLRGI
jgi:hypothetical protein